MAPTLRLSPYLLGAASLFLILVLPYSFSIGLQATRGAAITGDEPFYLLTTQSLLDDGDLDLRQQYERESYKSFFDHADGLWKQSVPTQDGQILSPHNPGLSVLVMPGFALAGLRGAQFELVLIAALTMALAYVFVAKETGAYLIGWLVTLAVGLSATAFVYSSEVYPEFPAALCLVLAMLLVGRRASIASGVALVVLLSALAWLGIKYVPLAAVIAMPFLLRAPWSSRGIFLGLSAVSALAYVWFHVSIFDDLTPYSVNTVYEGAPALDVLQAHVSFSDRVYRLWGLFVDQRFGIGRWAPVLLLVPVALPLLLRRGTVGLTVFALVLTQIVIATFVAITMMGWWFPGRTLVVVLPLFVLVLTALLQRFEGFVRVLAAMLGLYSVAITVALARAAGANEVRLAVDPFNMRTRLFQSVDWLFPNYTSWTTETVILTAMWLLAGILTTFMIVWRDYAVALLRLQQSPRPILRVARSAGGHN